MSSKQPAKFDGFVLTKGATFVVKFDYQNPDGTTVDLSSGFSAKMQIRRGDGTLLATLDSAGGGDGSITLSATNPNVSGELAASFTQNLELADEDTVFYDFLLTGTITEVILEGKITTQVPVTQ